MALFVYATDTMRDDARAQGVSADKIQRFCDDVERAQSTSTFDRFPPPYLTRKKIWNYNNRLVAAEHNVGAHLVIILLRLLVKSSRDYENQFTIDPHAYANPLLQEVLPHAEAWLAERTRSAPPPQMPVPTTAQQAFLWAEVGLETDRDAGDAIVCETERWIHSTSDSRIQDRLVLLPDLLLQLAHGEDAGPQLAHAQADARLRVAYLWCPSDRQLLLLDVAYERDIDAEKCFAEYVARMHQGEHFDLLRITRRSYPIEVCCDADMWLAIQRDAAANMALSPEEAGILRSVRTTRPTTGFPLFINGRAGSGKSTLLQYLFADYFSAWVKHLLDADAQSPSVPLYLASSRDLLATAKSAVRALLVANASRMMSAQCLDQSTLALLDGAFRTPMDYLVEHVASLAGSNRFDRSLYVNYPRFHRLWLDHFERDRHARRDYGPQLSWHVIRTHIKGQSADAELEPEDFASLPRNEQTVSRDRYRQVYDRVWSAWYAPLCKDHGYWDDQDLAADVTRLDFRGHHAALFCDESQDFTRRELEALHRCCGFSFMELTPDEAARVPFVFAGDPFQTLNPTGFRWEAVRAAFTEKIAGNLYRYRRWSQLPEINYRELTYNYRSSRHVVRLCNSVQAIRAIVMHESTLRPQTTWHLDATAPLPIFFHTTEPTLQRDIREQTDLVLIVPCEEDGEADYVEEHPAIKALVRRTADGIPQNVLSPARAKGLEFNRVAVVGFGSATEAAELARCLAEPDRLESMASDELLPIEYFLNKLYVACSRARRRLFIIDEPSDLQTLWGCALDHERLTALCDRVPAANALWREGVGHIAKGLSEHWRDDHNDPLETAARFESDGESKHDPYLLRQAALQYEVVGDAARAADCEGRAYEYQGQPVKAGESFVTSGNTGRALECFWEGERYDRVVDVATIDSVLRNRVEYRLAAFLCDKRSESGSALQLLQEIVTLGSNSPTFRSTCTHRGWTQALRGLLERASTFLGRSADETGWTTLSHIHQQLVDLGVPPDVNQRAEALFGARRFEDVTRLLAAKPDAKRYREAKTELLQAERRAGGTNRISVEDKKLAGDVCRGRRAFEDALWWYEAASWRPGLESCVEDMTEREKEDDGPRYINALARLAGEQGDWEYLVDLINGKGWTGLPAQSRAVVKSICTRLDLVRTVLIPGVALSDAAARSSPATRDRLTQQIKAHQKDTKGNWSADQMRALRMHGAAIERVGKDIDALQFYETVLDDKGCPEEVREYANRRWLHCKLRQERRERSQGRRQSADKYREQAEARLRTFAWSMEDLGPDYPSKRLIEHGHERGSRSTVSQQSIETPPEKSGTNEWMMGQLAFHYFQMSKRVNITSSVGEQARMDLNAHKVVSDEVAVERGDDGEWRIKAWKLRAKFLADERVVVVAIDEEERRIEWHEAQ